MCFEVEDIEKALREVEKKGIPLVNRTSKRGHQSSKIVFLNPSGANGVLLELCEKPK
jgi:methylmalonyl-CoA/ethylmalonyl-CoA epimerase